MNTNLPLEILAVVFEEYSVLVHEDGRPWQLHICDKVCLQNWICVTHVCRQWRAAALGCSVLWCRPPLVSHQWTKEFLSRSTNSPLIMSAHLITDHLFMQPVTETLYRSLVQPVTENLYRTRELVVETTAGPLGEILVDLHRQSLCQKSLPLEALSLIRVEAGGWGQDHLSPDIRLCSVRGLTRLHLSNTTHGLPPDFLDEMQSLQELSLVHTIWCLQEGQRNARIRLPRLRRLHLTENLTACRDYVATLELSGPLDYIGIEDDYSHLSPHELVSFAKNIFSTRHVIGQGGGVELPTTLDGYVAALSITLSRSYIHQVQFHFEACQSDAMDDLLFRALFERAISRTHKASTESVNLTALSEPYAGLYTSGILDLRISQFMPSMITLFSLNSIVCLYIVDKAHDTAASDFKAVFKLMPCLRTLAVSHIQPHSLARPLAPYQGHNGAFEIPVPQLRELTIDCVDFSAEKDHAQSGLSLAECLSARSARGSPLDKLLLIPCTETGDGR
ncbi:hypothetical protein CONPUDRAFT_169141 [Coniophora puteana RWD-64-598 SS2]|uniref:Uncharacterized protein n=1 Tax=Coniophora puteana (strain RWD-64-598) TaxID=741705 RepID=A0A5M3MAT4_CONPW|nr:uncharacterized protein CONPUDRAFT_169141 [Coniophora puteana RWD-64-598 SS2]EIW75900.1 hypothetical protein CONPUDRAFT_169141 [Coniophora puteana RWD-64-598 SS2]